MLLLQYNVNSRQFYNYSNLFQSMVKRSTFDASADYGKREILRYWIQNVNSPVDFVSIGSGVSFELKLIKNNRCGTSCCECGNHSEPHRAERVERWVNKRSAVRRLSQWGSGQAVQLPTSWIPVGRLDGRWVVRVLIDGARHKWKMR